MLYGVDVLKRGDRSLTQRDTSIRDLVFDEPAFWPPETHVLCVLQEITELLDKPELAHHRLAFR